MKLGAELTGPSKRLTSATLGAAAALAAALLLAGTSVQARVQGNPFPQLERGAAAAGAEVSQFNRNMEFENEGASDTERTDFDRTTFRFAYGMERNLVLDGYLGFVEFDADDVESLDGNELGVGGRYLLEDIGPELDAGATAALMLGTASSSDADLSYSQVDVAFGVSGALNPTLRAYGGGVYSNFSGTLETDDPDTEVDVSEDNAIGGFAGAELSPRDTGLSIGGELHLLHQTGFGFYALFRF